MAEAVLLYVFRIAFPASLLDNLHILHDETKKSCIRETLILSTDEDSSTDTSMRK